MGVAMIFWFLGICMGLGIGYEQAKNRYKKDAK